MSGPPFKYSPLDQSIKQIRLVKILPDLRDGLIQSRIGRVRFNVRPKPSYQALAYSLPSTSKRPNKHVLVNDKILEVPEQVYDFLEIIRQHLQRRRVDLDNEQPWYEGQEVDSGLLWIEHLCVDGDHDDERAYCARMQSEIFKQADRVYVWLGSSTPQREEAFRAEEAASARRNREISSGVAETNPEVASRRGLPHGSHNQASEYGGCQRCRDMYCLRNENIFVLLPTSRLHTGTGEPGDDPCCRIEKVDLKHMTPGLILPPYLQAPEAAFLELARVWAVIARNTKPPLDSWPVRDKLKMLEDAKGDSDLLNRSRARLYGLRECILEAIEWKAFLGILDIAWNLGLFRLHDRLIVIKDSIEGPQAIQLLDDFALKHAESNARLPQEELQSQQAARTALLDQIGHDYSQAWCKIEAIISRLRPTESVHGGRHPSASDAAKTPEDLEDWELVDAFGRGMKVKSLEDELSGEGENSYADVGNRCRTIKKLLQMRMPHWP